MIRTNDASADDLLRRLKAEFLEMPGLKLTMAQAQKLWALDSTSCSMMLETLVNVNFLWRTRDGAFMRVEHRTPAKARLTRPTEPAARA
jgi:hypothetical protein